MSRLKTSFNIVAVTATLAASPLVSAGGNDDPLLYMVKIDQLERRNGDEDSTVFEAKAWAGYDLQKLWLKTKIEHVESEDDKIELQLLYSHAISPYWNLALGARRDFKPEPERNWAVLNLHGLAPYYLEVDSALFIGESGRSALRVEVEHELMLTQRWALRPKLEVNFFGKNDDDTETGSGLSNTELGLRLAYEIRREFAPYIGLNWEKKYGNTADFARDKGEKTDDTQFVIGIHAWF